MILTKHLPCFLLYLAGARGGGMGETSTTAWASFNTHDVTLEGHQRHNTTVSLIISGTLKECLNVSFTYDPEHPSIEPLDGFPVCPPLLMANCDFPGHRLAPGRGPDNDLRLTNLPAHSTLQDPLRMRSSRTHLWVLLRGYLREEKRQARSPSLRQEPDTVVVNVTLCSRWVGKTVLALEADGPELDVSDAFIRVSVLHYPGLQVLSEVLGWTYTIIWDVSFLPQMWLNWRRKSVEGLSMDNVVLNLVAFMYYMFFNVGLYAIPLLQGQFSERYPREVNHVRLNDVVFAAYAFGTELLLALQCVLYKRGAGQAVSWPCRALVTAALGAVATTCVLAGLGVVWWLDVFYLMSYLKLGLTPLKYTPQAYVNYKRKSTIGFSIASVLMDLAGGVLSLAQMFILAANIDDWVSIFTDFSKFGLGVISIIFDLIFLSQHYYYHYHLG
nr:cystinosin-like [Procambarus clarkii]